MRACWHLLFATALVAALASHDVARGGDAPRAIDVIENDLVADDPAVRAKAAAELTDRFPDGAVAVPMLVDLLDDESPEVVAAAAKAIDSMAVAGAGPLAAWCADKAHWQADSELRAALVVGVRSHFQGGIDVFDRERRRRGLPPTSVDVVRSALCASPDVAPWLITVVRRHADETYVLAAAALAACGADVLWDRRVTVPTHTGRSMAAPAIAALLRSRSDLAAWTGARVAARLRSSDGDIVDALTAVVSAPYAPEATDASGTPQACSRDEACRALGCIGPAADIAAPVLIEQATTGAEALVPALALLRMGKERDVLAALNRNPKTADDLVEALAADRRALDVVVPRLVARLETSRGFDLSIFVLRDLGPSAAAALPALKKRLLEAKPGLARFYAEAVLAVSPTDLDALKLLDATTGSDDANGGIRIIALRAAPSPSVVARLLEFLAREATDESVLDPGVVDGIGRCGPLAKGAVGDLVVLLKRANDGYVDVEARPRFVNSRRSIVVALGRIGPDAAVAVPTLTALRDKGDETIRVPAAQALRRIRAKK